MWIVLGILLAVVVPLLAGMLYVRRQAAWNIANGQGTAYFGRTLAERRAFKEELRRRGKSVLPLVRFYTKLWKPRVATCRYQGVCGPAMACSAESFRRTAEYRPQAGDVFVATQMKCGTTWMQQVVYEVLCHGHGDLSDAGHRHLYALSPWIESSTSVSLEDAPRVGEARARIIKTHMPTQLTPYGPEARYIYVTRHPVACFASSVDFIRMLTGPMAWDDAGFLDWFCSERMWWRPWAEHVAGWWRWAQERPNVLFVHYEEMRENLPAVVARVADFLGVTLAPDELAEVVRKSSFDYMKANEELFEMAPPNFFSVAEGTFFVSGGRDRTQGVPPEARERILAFCRDGLRGSDYPAARFYPDLAD